MAIEMTEELRQAAVLMAEQKFDQARRAFERIAETQPEHAPLAASQVGVAYYFLGEYENAIACYQRAGELGFDAAMIADNIAEAREALAGVARSGSGAPVLRHAEVAPEEDDVAHADDERISRHIEKLFGDAGMVFHKNWPTVFPGSARSSAQWSIGRCNTAMSSSAAR